MPHPAEHGHHPHDVDVHAEELHHEREQEELAARGAQGGDGLEAKQLAAGPVKLSGEVQGLEDVVKTSWSLLEYKQNTKGYNRCSFVSISFSSQN